MKKNYLKNVFTMCFLIAFSMCKAVSAADYPTLAELYGRYTFSGTMTSAAEEEGETALEPAARTGYKMAIIPGEAANEVKVLGFCGYGGGLTATYDEAEGKLHCGQNSFSVCGSMSMMTGAGMMANVDAGVTEDFEPLYLDLNFQVSEQDGAIVITAAESLEVLAMALGEEGFEQDFWTYAAGYTLTKDNMSLASTEVAGTYTFKGNEVIDVSVEDAFEEFSLTLTAKENGKISVSGLFGFNDEIEADYLENGGIIVLPRDFTFANGLFTGNREGTDENYMIDAVNRMEAAPYFFAEDGKLTTPSTFAVNGEFDADMFMRPCFSFCGGEGTKADGTGVETVAAAGKMSVTSVAGGISVECASASSIEVYNAGGMKVAETTASSAEISGLATGLYIVKAGEHTAKVIVK